ncbi:MAG: acetyl-CoA carboxylase biotin carboxyl carrier protein [Candidatus Aminicenantes bacterium]|nr:acetyl-CoA carboxylase biotin carboxyl carrier protein [Candidatus Aminicenantes bacterium]
MDVQKLLEWLKKYDLTELTIKDGGYQVTLKREGQPAAFPHQSLPGIDEAVAAADGTCEPVASAAEPEDAPDKPELHEVKAPLVGTFYRAPAPDAAPFIEEGDRVEVNDKLCIVEAMKIMNEIESPVRGIVREICARNGATVEFGQVLFRIEEPS